jgi:hypothetical protein
MLRRILLCAKRANTNSQKTSSEVNRAVSLDNNPSSRFNQHQIFGALIFAAIRSQLLTAAAIARTTTSRQQN